MIPGHRKSPTAGLGAKFQALSQPITEKEEKSGSAFFKRFEGALDAGYAKDEAAAIAHGGGPRAARKK